METRLELLEARLARLEAERESEQSELRERLASVERRNRGLAGLSVAVLAGTLLVGLAQPGQTQVDANARRVTKVRAPFSVVSRRGKKLFEISESGNGGALTLYDTAGKPIIAASSLEGGRGFSVHDSNGVAVGRIGVLSGTAVGDIRQMELFDGSGINIGGFTQGVDTTGEWRSAAVYTAEGKRLVELGINTDGFVGLDVASPAQVSGDTDGLESVRVGVHGADRGVDIFDDNGTEVLELGIDSTSGVRGLDVHNTAGGRVGALGAGPNGGTLQLFSNGGTPTTTLP